MKNMDLEKAIKQLKDLIIDRESFIQNDGDHDDIFLRDKQAIETVLREIENRIPKKKIEDKIKELESMINKSIEGELQKYTPGEMFLLKHFLEELLEDKNYE